MLFGLYILFKYKVSASDCDTIKYVMPTVLMTAMVKTRLKCVKNFLQMSESNQGTQVLMGKNYTE